MIAQAGSGIAVVPVDQSDLPKDVVSDLGGGCEEPAVFRIKQDPR